MTLKEAYMETKGRLGQAGISAFDAACLFEYHTGVKRQELPLCGDKSAPENLSGLWKDVDRRINGEPLQYLLGQWEFMGLPFKVGPGVLIPRPETEFLAETAINFLQNRKSPAMLELCAGSGCVTISAALQKTDGIFYCLELSGDAIFYLCRNISLHRLDGRVKVVKGDILSAPADSIPSRLDAIVCNPPYIRTSDIDGLQREIRCHEPRCALDGGDDGLRFYRSFSLWRGLLKPGGLAAFEIGQGEAEDVSKILSESGLTGTFIKKDYAGIKRIVGGFAPGTS